ncbi:MAG: hypothetical protein Q8S31_07585 [Alphaproteobacteria bacterium]|nr:hypothetical protein [Alphaproteobacteria bacterium]
MVKSKYKWPGSTTPYNTEEKILEVQNKPKNRPRKSLSYKKT